MKHNWDLKPFTDVATTITPTSKIEKSEYMNSGIYPIISQEDSLISGFWNDPQDLTPHNTPVVIFGDHTRVLKYVDFEFVVGADGVKIIKPNENLNTKFLYHYLRWLNVPSLGYARHFKLVKEAQYTVPPMEVQEQIVAELDKINEIISDCKEAIRNLDSLAQSLFYDYFGDPNTKMKFSKVLFGTISKNLDYQRRPITQSDRISGPYPYYGASGIIDYVENYIFDGRFLLISEDGANLLARTQPIAFITEGKVWVNNHAHIVDFENDFSKIYFKFYLNLLDFRNKITGAAQPKFTQKALNELEVAWPTLDLQEKFATRIEQIEQQKKGLEETISNMQTLLDSRMDYWFN